MGHTASAIVRFDDDAHGRVQKHYRQLHAARAQRGPVRQFSGTTERSPDDHYDDLHDHHPVRFDAEVAQSTFQRKARPSACGKLTPTFRYFGSRAPGSAFSLNSRPACSFSLSPTLEPSSLAADV